jgi:hypothetical protein
MNVKKAFVNFQENRNVAYVCMLDTSCLIVVFVCRYLTVLCQYEAVSFGDKLFTNYVLLPLQQRHLLALRKLVWGEHMPALMHMRLLPHEVGYLKNIFQRC